EWGVRAGGHMLGGGAGDPGSVGFHAALLRPLRARTRAAEDGEPLPAGGGELPAGIACAALGSLAVYAALFATGLALYGRPLAATLLAVLGLIAGLAIHRLWSRASATA
ncbi:MAG: hypothetical protein ACRD2Z_02845, partial [Thermoanaerobaculia bacterium]